VLNERRCLRITDEERCAPASLRTRRLPTLPGNFALHRLPGVPDELPFVVRIDAERQRSVKMWLTFLLAPACAELTRCAHASRMVCYLDHKVSNS
jgi:hypothetical protein